MKEGDYKITTTNYVFEMQVMEYGGIYEIKYGDPENREGPCIDINYDTRTDDTILKLESISYYERCAKNKSLERGDGTREMLKSVLKICVDKFPNVKKIYFRDVSAFPCANKYTYLSYYSLLIYGQTWYERYFQAKPINKMDRQSLNEFRELLAHKPESGIFTFYKHNTDHKTWNEYFASKKEDCEFFINIQDEIKKVLKVNLVYSEWYIRAKDVARYDINIHKTEIKKKNRMHSGGKYMRLTMEDAH